MCANSHLRKRLALHLCTYLGGFRFKLQTLQDGGSGVSCVWQIDWAETRERDGFQAMAYFE